MCQEKVCDFLLSLVTIVGHLRKIHWIHKFFLWSSVCQDDLRHNSRSIARENLRCGGAAAGKKPLVAALTKFQHDQPKWKTSFGTKNKLMYYPQQLGRSWKVFVPEPSGTLSAMCTGQLSNFVCYLHRTIRNFMGHLHRDPPNLISHPEPSSISSAILFARNRLRRNPPELHQPSAPEGSGTLRNLLRNLVLQLHRIAPELFWAKDPIASFAVGEKRMFLSWTLYPYTDTVKCLEPRLMTNIVVHFEVPNSCRQHSRRSSMGSLKTTCEGW